MVVNRVLSQLLYLPLIFVHRLLCFFLVRLRVVSQGLATTVHTVVLGVVQGGTFFADFFSKNPLVL